MVDRCSSVLVRYGPMMYRRGLVPARRGATRSNCGRSRPISTPRRCCCRLPARDLLASACPRCRGLLAPACPRCRGLLASACPRCCGLLASAYPRCCGCMGVCMREWVHACMRACLHACVHVRMRRCVCACMHTCMRALCAWLGPLESASIAAEAVHSSTTCACVRCMHCVCCVRFVRCMRCVRTGGLSVWLPQCGGDSG